MASATSTCQECDNDVAEHYCEDCDEGSQYYCSDCATSHLKKKKYAKHSMKVIGDESDDIGPVPFKEFVSQLGFSEFFSQSGKKLTNKDAVTIHHMDYNASNTFQPKKLLPLILQKVMACNHLCQQVVLQTQTDHKPYPNVHHPMDTLLALILSCDSIFLQDVFKRLYACKLAIPLLLLNPDTKQIIFPLWAMREMVSEWKYCNAAGEYIPCGGRLVDCEAPIVSFMRLNKVKDLYKSKILNGVISDSRHQYFFDFECPGSDAKRCYVDGLAEISWYLPSGNPQSDIYPTPVAFCNLRGDARDHLTQFKVLTSISQICFLFVENNDVNESLKKMLCSTSRKSHTYLLMNTCSHMDIVNQIPNCSVLPLRTKQGPAALITMIRLKICEVLPSVSQDQYDVPLSNIFKLESCGRLFDVDELCDPISVAGKKSADKVMMHIGTNSLMAKQALVPLQGKTYWQEWAKQDKEQTKCITNTQDFHLHKKKLDNLIQEMIKIGYSSAMKIFIDTLIDTTTGWQEKRYFLQWLKMQIDDYSRKTLPKLQSKCKITRELLKVNEETTIENKAERVQLRKRLCLENQDVLNASFGLEHFFRELGVIYEMDSRSSAASVTSPMFSQVNKFPKIAANLLMDGQALELLDGDAAYVSINWITAVLRELKEIIGEKSKLFVLSVLGIQSSGKSTLLNTAFGLRFAVSAGRCTRGAFFQLLKCDDKFEGICDYMLVIDTEGLRAPELEHEDTQKHDNELATLVIGLAGLTIVNIMGEVSGEMDNILQTCVHAFLRMKEVELRPSCIIVKQNVNEVTAHRGIEGLHNVLDKLDQMTVYAAREEHSEGVYNKFSDVIQFNIEKDVLHFDSLWGPGRPPMSPISPDYSKAAQKMKMEIIKKIMADPNLVCTLGGFSERVTNLWKALCEADFVFNFKNAQEASAFKELDKKIAEWSWDLENVLLLWEDKTRSDLKIGQFKSEDEVQKAAIKDVDDRLDEKYDEIKENVENFFKEYRSASIAEENSSTEKKFINYLEEHKKKARKFCENLIKNEKLLEKVKNEEENQEKIMKNVKKLVEEMKIDKDTKITHEMEDEFKQKFLSEWTKWMKEIEKEAPPLPSENIEDEILQMLYYRCGIKHLHDVIRKRVQSTPLSGRAQNDHLFLTVEREKHLKIVEQGAVKLKRDQNPQRIQEIHENVNKQTAAILLKQKLYLDSVSTKDEYRIGEIQKVVRSIQEDIEKLQCEVIEIFSLTPEYNADVILTVCGYALRVFEKQRRRSYENHPLTVFKSLEEIYETKFLTLCRQGVGEKVTASAAKSLSFLVIRSVETEFEGRLKNALESKLRNQKTFFRETKALKKEVLLRLLNEGSFSFYTTYITNVSQSYSYWMQKFVDEQCESTISKGKSLIATVADEELQKLKRAICDYTVAKKDSVSNFEKWLEMFPGSVKLSINPNHLKAHVGDYEIEATFELFKEEFLKRFESDIDDFATNKVQSLFYRCRNEIANRFYSSTAGCTAQCPFCKEQCECTTPGHGGYHYCYMHRPQCLGGWRDSDTDEMTLELCNDAVRSNDTFKCSQTGWKSAGYRYYQSYFPTWRIDGYGSSYWQWFVSEYTGDIARYWNMKQPYNKWETIQNWKRWYSRYDAAEEVHRL